MAEQFNTPLPADLPEDWALGQTVAPNGADVGLSEQHGFNYLAKQVNDTQKKVNHHVGESAGRSMAGKSVEPTQGTIVTAKDGAEIFNDCRERLFNANGSIQQGNVASGLYYCAGGTRTTALGSYSHTEGQNTTASGSTSHSEGFGTTASGSNSHAEGHGTTASGSYSHAEGGDTTASGSHSRAGGFNTKANDYQTVIGTNNVEKPSNGVSDDRFIIGGGWGALKNCFRVHSNGSVYGGPYNSSGAD